MKAEKVGTKDIFNLAAGRLEVELPDYGACETAKNLVTRVKARYPDENGKTFTTSVDKGTNTITIGYVNPEDVNRKDKK